MYEDKDNQQVFGEIRKTKNWSKCNRRVIIDNMDHLDELQKYFPWVKKKRIHETAEGMTPNFCIEIIETKRL